MGLADFPCWSIRWKCVSWRSSHFCCSLFASFFFLFSPFSLSSSSLSHSLFLCPFISFFPFLSLSLTFLYLFLSSYLSLSLSMSLSLRLYFLSILSTKRLQQSFYAPSSFSSHLLYSFFSLYLSFPLFLFFTSLSFSLSEVTSFYLSHKAPFLWTMPCSRLQKAPPSLSSIATVQTFWIS